MTGRLIVDLGEDGTVRVGEVAPGEPFEPGAPLPFAWPLDSDALEDLRWYLEDYLRAPFGVYEDRGARIEGELPGWGASVFASVFGSGPARDAYVRLRRRGDVELVLRSASPALLGLPWELMTDPRQGAPLAVELAGMSRTLSTCTAPAEAVPVPGGRLRILMVVSRPSGAEDVGYQMIARPLLKRLEAMKEAAELTVLRPPTLHALRDELDAADREGRPYQVVHFDGHGTFVGGRDFGGGEGALVFERPDGGPHLVPAAEIARVLNAAHVPVVVLNACESGAIGKNLETAVATRLLSEGTASVVAMAYTVQAVAAAEFMAAFYEKIFAGGSVSAAVTAGRRQMFRSPGRPSPKGQMPLRDWLVAVHYLGRPVSFQHTAAAHGGRPASRADARKAQVHPRSASPFEPEASVLDAANGVFVGRDARIYDLEAAARLRKVVVVTGIAGSGKTELAKAFGRWWRDTAGVEKPEWIFWHSFDPGVPAVDLDTVIAPIGVGLRGPDFLRLTRDQRRAVVRNALHDHRMLLIWDGFESLRTMPDPENTTPILDEEKCVELRQFLVDLAENGTSSVLITSRSREDWLGQVGRVRVDGLARHEAAEFADVLLAGHPMALERRAERSYADLMEWLDGHPASMELVLPHLDTASPEELLAELRGGTSHTALSNRGEEHAAAMWADIAYSYAHLTETTRRLLPVVSLFYGVVDLAVLSALTVIPGVPQRFARATFDDWKSALDDATALGLLTYIGTTFYKLHPALPAFLRNAWRTENPDTYEADHEAALGVLTHAHAGICIALTQQVDAGDQMVYGMIALVRHTLGNYLGYALDHTRWDDAQLILRALKKFWRFVGIEAEFDPWSERIIRATGGPDGTIPRVDTPAGDLWLYTVEGRAGRDLDLRRLDEAERGYLKAVAAIELTGADAERRHGLDVCYHQLGMVAAARGRTAEAEDRYRKAMALKDEDDNASSAANTYHQLALTALERGNHVEAEEWQRKALAIRLEAGDKTRIAESYHSLGMIAEYKDQLVAAVDWYLQALDALESLGDPTRMAGDIRSQLGNVAIRRARLDQAEGWYREALVIQEALDNRPGMAHAYHNLGIIAHQRRRLSEAEGWYHRALAIYEDFSDDERMATCYHQLGTLAYSRNELEEAEDWYNKALAVKEHDDASPNDLAPTYGQLGLLAEKKGNLLEALTWMIKCVALFDEFPHPMTGPAPKHLVRLVDSWTFPPMEMLEEWWDEVTGEPVPGSVRDYVQANLALRAEERKKNRTAPPPTRRPERRAPTSSRLSGRKDLGDLLLSVGIDESIDVSEMSGSGLTAVPREENRSGWRLSLPEGRRFLGEESWPVYHHNHFVGYLLWCRDKSGVTGWEIAMPDGRWVEKGQEFSETFRQWPWRYIFPPPAKRSGGIVRLWTDPADLLVGVADWHYCPRTAIATLFRLVEEGMSASEASRTVHLVGSVGQRLVRRAKRKRAASGLPLSVQVDDFLPIRESDWESGLV
ncbi:tetratricopeptide repeat protein [Streptomyces sp. NPDC046881]|uniref:tetratricopeptide repeat protein n=1 Tax=Streptomyces sp. NPDC046881 TaxID=3155374 RepID=UPI0033CEF4BF